MEFLLEDEKLKLSKQNTRLVPDVKAIELERNAKKHWDLFYKRNKTNFFKDRHWTIREFHELLADNRSQEAIDSDETFDEKEKKILLEVGCGVGNLIFPLIQERNFNYFIYACDFSPRAIEFVEQNEFYDKSCIKAFQCDITTSGIETIISSSSVDIITLIFVLSAIHPDNFLDVFRRLYVLLKPGGMLLFRDYGLHDMAQIRFKPGHKISENFYMRQDGTRSFYFSVEYLERLVLSAGFEVKINEYVYRRTVNVKENVDLKRTFLQGKFIKPFSR